MISVIASEPLMIMAIQKISFDLNEFALSAISSDWASFVKGLPIISEDIGSKNLEVDDLVKEKILKEIADEVEIEKIKDEDSDSFIASLFDDKYIVRVKPDDDYQSGTLDRLAPGTYIEIIKLNPAYMESDLFGFTYPSGSPHVYIRGDLKGEALKRVIQHEVAHYALGLGEEAARDATGTHMHEFLPLFEKSRYN